MPLMDVVEEALAALGVEFEVMDCDPEYADTAAFCEHYGVDPADSANTILIASKRPPSRLAACVALATTRLDVNRTVRDEMDVKKLSFADADTTLQVTGMAIGGVTPFGLPPELPVLVDEAVFSRPSIVLGGGNRSSKLRIDPAALERIPTARRISGLAG